MGLNPGPHPPPVVPRPQSPWVSLRPVSALADDCLSGALQLRPGTGSPVWPANDPPASVSLRPRPCGPNCGGGPRRARGWRRRRCGTTTRTRRCPASTRTSSGSTRRRRWARPWGRRPGGGWAGRGLGHDGHARREPAEEYSLDIAAVGWLDCTDGVSLSQALQNLLCRGGVPPNSPLTQFPALGPSPGVAEHIGRGTALHEVARIIAARGTWGPQASGTPVLARTGGWVVSSPASINL